MDQLGLHTMSQNDSYIDEDGRDAGPLAAYIHVPFCGHRCGYCSFSVVASRDDLIEDFLRALATELSWLKEPKEVGTIYIGGGTPSRLGAGQWTAMTELLSRWFPLEPGGEFSMEANPEDVTLERLEMWRKGGVNRLSLGVQSIDDAKLKFLERSHREQHIRECVDLVQPRIPNFSLDLMFGVEDESLSVWKVDLEFAVESGAKHVSTYGLTYEKGTRFWNTLQRGDVALVCEDLDRQMYETAIDTLRPAGFEHYEVSNFARPGFRCCHNEKYWLGGEYFAAGPGAARFVAGRREVNHRSTFTYLKKVLAGQSPVMESEKLDPLNQARERLVFGLRRLEGVDADEFVSRIGVTVEELAGASLARFVDQGLLVWKDRRIRLTRDGLLVSDAIWPHLLVP